MKKMIYAVFAIIGAIVFSSAALAKNNEAPVTMPQPQSVNSTAICDNWPTCINIYNYSSYQIGIWVASPVNFSTVLNPGMMQAVQWTDYSDKYVELNDYWGVFFRGWVPAHHDILVGNYNSQGKAMVTFSKK